MQSTADSPQTSAPPVLVPAIGAALAMALCVGLAAFLEHGADRRARHASSIKVRDALLRKGAVLRSAIMTRAYLLRPLDALVSTSPQISQEQFAPFAGQALGRFSQVGVASLQLARGSKVSHVFPAELVDQRLGWDLELDESQASAIEASSLSHQFALGQPFMNAAGVLTIFVHTSIFLGSEGGGGPRFWGVGSVEIDVHAMLDEVDKILLSTSADRDEFSLRLAGDRGEGRSFHGQDSLFGAEYESVIIELPGQSWEIGTLPVQDHLGMLQALFLRLNGFLVGSLLAFLVWTKTRRASILTSTVERATRDLLTSKRRLAMLMEASPVGLFEVDPVKGCTFVNASWCEQSGVTPEYAEGRDWLRVIHPEDLEVASEAWQRFVSGDDEFSLEFRYLRPDGSVCWVDCSATRIADESGVASGFVCASLDITARLESERDHARLEAQVLHSQKLESLGVLAGGIAHDFNNLLMGVVGYSDLALLAMGPDSPARDHISEVLIAAKRAGALCAQMLNYAGKGKLEMKAVDLNTITREVPELLASSVIKSVRLDYELGEGMPLVMADSSQLVQIVLNLVVNGSESIEECRTDDKGVIVVRTGVVELCVDDLGSLHYNGGLAPGPAAYFEVEDNGGGIPSDVFERMFEPFFTTKFAGRGLGMSAILGIVGSHGGGIAVSSRRDEGARFTVYLPLSEVADSEAMADETNLAGEGGLVSLDGPVLLIDDDDDVRRPARLLLEKAGLEVREAASGEDGLAALRSSSQPFSLVVLDATMPGMGGEECLHRIRVEAPGVPVLLISGFAAGKWLRDASDEPDVAFLPKPFGGRSLLAAVRELAD